MCIGLPILNHLLMNEFLPTIHYSENIAESWLLFGAIHVQKRILLEFYSETVILPFLKMQSFNWDPVLMICVAIFA